MAIIHYERTEYTRIDSRHAVRNTDML